MTTYLTGCMNNEWSLSREKRPCNISPCTCVFFLFLTLKNACWMDLFSQVQHRLTYARRLNRCHCAETPKQIRARDVLGQALRDTSILPAREQTHAVSFDVRDTVLCKSNGYIHNLPRKLFLSYTQDRETF